MADGAPTRLGVFAKYWQPGHVKTRLARDIGEEAASTLYRQFVEVTLERLGCAAERLDLCIWPPDRVEEAHRLVPRPWHVRPQSEGDLGQKMARYFEQAFAAGSDRVVLVGSDTPTLPLAAITESFAVLKRASVVLGPSEDGGYYLVGARGEVPPIFANIDWGTPQVWEQTTEALAAAGLRPSEGFVTLPSFNDIDTVDDLQALRGQLAGRNGADETLERLAAVIDQVLP